MRRFTLVVLMMLFVAATAVASEFPKIGEKAPSFELQTNDGKIAKLDDYRGKWVVLYFYPKDFTSGCTLQAHNFQRDLAEYGKRNAIIVGVSVDDAKSHSEFCAKEKLEFTLLADTEAKLSKAYNSVMDYKGQTLSARNTFLIDPNGKIAQVFPSVKPASHSEEVLAVLDQLQKK